MRPALKPTRSPAWPRCDVRRLLIIPRHRVSIAAGFEGDIVPTSYLKGPRTAAVNLALAGLVALTVVASIVTLLVSADYYVGLSHSREKVQAQNALDLKLERLRGDLTSVTFWDEAVEHTAGRFDEAWVDENIGRWLYSFYETDRVFVLGADDQPIYANADGVQLPPEAYAIVATSAAPLVAQVRARAGTYRPASAEPTVKRNLSRGYDAASFALIDDRPVYLVVAPILPDFARKPIDPSAYGLLVTVYEVDAAFLAELSRSVLIRRMSLTNWPADEVDGETVLMLRDAAARPIALLSWQPERYLSDVVARLLPFALVVLLVMSAAALLVYRFIQRSTRDLTATRHEARHDALTGLANRRLLTERLARALDRDSGHAALLFVDLDRFKDVNDIWGHEAGDAVLRTAARRIAQLFPDDLVARFGGDEFVILLIDRDPDEARARAGALLAVLADPYRIGKAELTLPGSVGLAMAPGSPISVDELLRRADTALYQAKTRGRNRVVVYERTMDDGLQHRRRVEAALRRALEDGAIDILYQPKVAAQTSRVTGVEALARFVDEDGRPVPPSVFVPVAEECGLIAPLGEHMLRTACIDAVRWPEIGVAVNLSPAQFRADDIVDIVRSALAESGLAPGRLTLEITETLLVKDPEGARQRLDALREMGVRLALDDFGTGYSSLIYLQRFKLDELKIAQGFLDDLAPNTDAMTVLSSIVTLGHALGLSVVAEGVETLRQVELLKRAGADQFQGNIFAEPMGRSTLESTLLSGDGAIIHLRQAATRAV